jgi:hypothetical protein
MFRSMPRNRKSTSSCLASLRRPARLLCMAMVATVVFAAAAPARAQDPPEISDFYCINDYGDYWTFTGVVTDNDDPVAGDVVTFGGVLSGYHLSAVVDADGVFCLTVELPGLREGEATAQTKDRHGAKSEVAWDWVVPY